MEQSYQKNVTHKIGVQGEVTVGLKNGLAAALIAKANATVKIRADWEGSWEEGYDVTINKTMPQCTKHQYKYYKVKHVASGTQAEAEDAWSDSKGHSGFAIKRSPRVHRPDGQGDVEFSRVLDHVLDFRVTIH